MPDQTPDPQPDQTPDQQTGQQPDQTTQPDATTPHSPRPNGYTTRWQRGEGAAIFVVALAWLIITPSPLPLWGMVLLFFAPDLSFFAYAISRRIGAASYNAWHLYSTGLAIAALGFWLDAALLSAIGVAWLGHAGFDRALGYGLKEAGSFDQTHLGPIGKAKHSA